MPVSRTEQNDMAPAFHLLAIGVNQSENKNTKAKMDSGFRRNDERKPNSSRVPRREPRLP
ncbi:MAG: hypothetical protein OXG62_15595 [Nitrospinae bacterium]|nr:hypothetical protein [Nitrospinota bacterium]